MRQGGTNRGGTAFLRLTLVRAALTVSNRCLWVELEPIACTAQPPSSREHLVAPIQRPVWRKCPVKRPHWRKIVCDG